MPTNTVTTGVLYVRDSSPDESPWTCNGWDMAERNGAGEIDLIRESEGATWSLSERMKVLRDDFEDNWSAAIAKAEAVTP